MALIERVVPWVYMRPPASLTSLATLAWVCHETGSSPCRVVTMPNITGRRYVSARCFIQPRNSTLSACEVSTAPVWKMPAPRSAMEATMSSISRRSAERLATGVPSGVWWVWVSEVDRPMAPARSASCASPAMVRTSSSVACSESARRPITYIRSAEWPTYIAWFSAFGRCSTAARYSAKDSHVQSMPAAMAAAGMSST